MDYRALVRDFGARGQCRIHRLTLDGRTVAAQFALRGGRQLTIAQDLKGRAQADKLLASIGGWTGYATR